VPAVSAITAADSLRSASPKPRPAHPLPSSTPRRARTSTPGGASPRRLPGVIGPCSGTCKSESAVRAAASRGVGDQYRTVVEDGEASGVAVGSFQCLPPCPRRCSSHRHVSWRPLGHARHCLTTSHRPPATARTATAPRRCGCATSLTPPQRPPHPRKWNTSAAWTDRSGGGAPRPRASQRSMPGRQRAVPYSMGETPTMVDSPV